MSKRKADKWERKAARLLESMGMWALNGMVKKVAAALRRVNRRAYLEGYSDGMKDGKEAYAPMSDQTSAGEQAVRKLSELLEEGNATPVFTFNRDQLRELLTAHAAEAKLAGELKRQKDIIAFLRACVGVRDAPSDNRLLSEVADALEKLPLTSDSAGVLERELKAEYARGYENGRNTACPVDGEGHPYGPQSGD